MNRPHTALVALAWLAGVAGLDDVPADTKTPTDDAALTTTGVLTVTPVGGSPAVDTPLRRPVVQVDAWALAPEAGERPWRRAGHLAELVVAGCYAAPDVVARTVTLPAGYLGARVLSVYPTTEPRRLDDPEDGMARYTVDLHVAWTAIG